MIELTFLKALALIRQVHQKGCGGVIFVPIERGLRRSYSY